MQRVPPVLVWRIQLPEHLLTVTICHPLQCMSWHTASTHAAHAVFVSSLYCPPRQHSQVAWQVASGSQTHKLQGRRAHSAAGVVLVIAHEDVPLGLLVQLGGRADGHRPQQAVQLLLGPQLRQEYVPGRVMLLDGWRP